MSDPIIRPADPLQARATAALVDVISDEIIALHEMQRLLDADPPADPVTNGVLAKQLERWRRATALGWLRAVRVKSSQEEIA